MRNLGTVIRSRLQSYTIQYPAKQNLAHPQFEEGCEASCQHPRAYI